VKQAEVVQCAIPLMTFKKISWQATYLLLTN